MNRIHALPHRCPHWPRVSLALVALLLGAVAPPTDLQADGEGPRIDSLEPSRGPAGTMVTLRGGGFGPRVGALQGTSGVSFNGAWATPSRWSDTLIEVPVPPGASSGEVVVSVGGRAGNGVSFTVTGPEISIPAIATVSPLMGPPGTRVTLRGANFGTAQGTATVSFDGVEAHPDSWSEGEIRAVVPEGAGTGPVAVTVEGKTSAGVPFTVTESGLAAPRLDWMGPVEGPEGTTVQIEGTRFGSYPGVERGVSGVSFAGVWATPSHWSGTLIEVPVPRGAPSGPVVVSVNGRASAALDFTVSRPPPVIRRLTPLHGPEGTLVRIEGSHFGSPLGARQGRSGVRFDQVWGEPLSWSDGEVRVAVPAGVWGGPVVVVVDGRQSNGWAFTVTGGPPAGKAAKGRAYPASVSAATLGEEEDEEASGEALEPAAPHIKGVYPSSGPVGTAVLIRGNNFQSSQGEGTVTFNGVEATPAVWQEERIEVPVPAGATTGPVVVTVGGQASNGVSFTVTAGGPAISGLSPSSGPAGTAVAITGTWFGAAQGTSTVTFNGVETVPSSWSDTRIEAPVPESATSGPVVVTVDGQASNGVAFTVPNRAPVAEGAIPARTVRNGAYKDLDASGHFSDPDGDPLTYTAVSSDASTVTVSVSGATVTLTGVARGEAAVTVTASDGELSAEQTVTVTVTNGAPVAGSIPGQTVGMDTRKDLDASGYFSDPDGDALTYTAVSSDTARVSVAVSGAVVTLTGVAKGEATVTVTASDGELSASQSFTVTVPNRAPVVEWDMPDQLFQPGGKIHVFVFASFSDPDGDTLTMESDSSDTEVVSVKVSGGILAIVKGVAPGEATVTMRASDGELSASLSFTVTVTDGTPMTEGTLPGQTIEAGAHKALDVSNYFSDPGRDPLTYAALSSDSAIVTASVAGSVVTLRGVAKGEATVTVTASDGELSASLSFTVTVPNRAPLAVGTIPGQAVKPGARKTVNVSGAFSDPDGDPLSHSALSSDASIVTVAVSGTTVAVTAVAAGSATVTVTASDGELSAGLSFTVTVVPNRAPVVKKTIPNYTINKGSQRTLSVTTYFSDPDNDPLTCSLSSSNASKVSVSGCAFTGKATGSATVTMRASDGELSETQSFTVTVREPDPDPVDPPVIDYFTANPASICSEGSSTLRWGTTGATSVWISRKVNGRWQKLGGNVSNDGSRSVSPNSTRDYRLSAKNSGGTVSKNVTVTVGTKPTIRSFGASPTSINKGETSTLSWETTGATSVSINHGVGDVTNDSDKRRGVSPPSTTTYTLTATNSCGSVEAEATVEVKPPPPPVIEKFDADPSEICSGGCSTLNWIITGATSASINQGIGSVHHKKGDRSVCPPSTTTYTLTASNGTVSVSKNVTVTVGTKPTIRSFGASPTSINKGETSTLSWETTGATSVSINHGVGDVTNDSDKRRGVSPPSTTTYTLTATNSCGSVEAEATVEVKPPPPPVIEKFDADPSEICSGGCSTLNWIITGATSASINQGIGSVHHKKGDRSVCPPSTTTYTLTASNGTVSVSESVTVTVKKLPKITFTANPTSINKGSSSTLSWSISGATSASINQGIGSVNRISGTRSVSPSSTTTYTLTAINACGSPTRSTKVTVTVPAPRIDSISPSLQRPDDPVTISGAHFGSSGSVSFGGSSATVNSWSNSSIGVLIPRWLSAGTVSVTVTANGKTSNSYSYTVTGYPPWQAEECKEGEECESEDPKGEGDSEEAEEEGDEPPPEESEGDSEGEG